MVLLSDILEFPETGNPPREKCFVIPRILLVKILFILYCQSLIREVQSGEWCIKKNSPYLGARKYPYFLPVELSDIEPKEGVHRFSKNLVTTQNSGSQKGDMN